jgi:hypothetical protein
VGNYKEKLIQIVRRVDLSMFQVLLLYSLYVLCNWKVDNCNFYGEIGEIGIMKVVSVLRRRRWWPLWWPLW